MIGPDEIGERRQRNNTPAIALGFAAALLLVVGFMSYRDFMQTSIKNEVKEELKEEFAARERQLMNQYGAVQPGAPAGRNQVAPVQNTQATGNAGLTASNQTFQGTTANQIQPGLYQQSDPALDQAAANMQIENSLPTPQDPEIQQLRNSLDQSRELTTRINQRYEAITEGLDTQIQGATNTTQEEGIGELPDFLREAVENPPGGNPAVEAQLERMREQVKLSPALAKVTGYDDEWGLVTFNAGSQQGVKRNQRFAVRRGETILGWVKVDEVYDNQAIANLITRNKNSDTSLKPGVGDDLIDFELF